MKELENYAQSSEDGHDYNSGRQAQQGEAEQRNCLGYGHVDLEAALFFESQCLILHYILARLVVRHGYHQGSEQKCQWE